MDVSEIKDPNSFKTWLQDKPKEWAQVLAARCALRVAPIAWSVAALSDDILEKKHRENLTLLTFRACFISSVGRKYPTDDMKRAARAADAATYAAYVIDAAALAATNAATNDAAAAPAAAAAAAAAARAAAAAAADAAAAAVAARGAASGAASAYASTDSAMTSTSPVYVAASFFWDTLREDCSWLAVVAEVDDTDSAKQAQALSNQPLWMNLTGFEALPMGLQQDFYQFNESELAQTTSFGLITDWYASILQGKPSPFSKEAELAIALMSKEDWGDEDDERDCVAVMDRVAKLAGWGLGGDGVVGDGDFDGDNLAETSKINNSNEDIDIELTAESHLASDVADSDVDSLGRSEIAFILAKNLNLIWDERNKEDREDNKSQLKSRWEKTPEPGFVVHVDAPWGGGKTSFANYLKSILNPYRDPPPIHSWMVELPFDNEEDWPKQFRKPWHIVDFNAWKHQDLTPPWWAFYQAIRQQCMKSLWYETNALAMHRTWFDKQTHEDPLQGAQIPDPIDSYAHRDVFEKGYTWIRIWLSEWWWRIFNPTVSSWAVIVIVAITGLTLLELNGFITISEFKIGPPSIPDQNAENASRSVGGFAIIMTVLFGGAASLLKLASSFANTLASGAPTADNNYGMGTADPLERFRKHFQKTIKAFRRPVIVVVDDLDRCKPEFVVELVRGMQTILVSQRVIFVLLCDRDWIERAFAEVNKSMVGIDVGPEHSFGGRFVEKAIQLSFVLPEPDTEQKKNYLRHVLGVQEFARDSNPVSESEMDDEIANVQIDMNRVEETLSKAAKNIMSISDFKAREQANADFQASLISGDLGLAESEKEEVLTRLNRRMALRSSSDETAAVETGHMLVQILELLPNNPRQAKRIVSAMVLSQEILRLRETNYRLGDEKWQLLARWVIMMIEWPKSWYTLSKFPELADKLLTESPQTNDDMSADEQIKYIEQLKKSKTVMQLLKFDLDVRGWEKDQEISSSEIKWLVKVLPATSGELIQVESS